jgi:hypothetical protein
MQASEVETPRRFLMVFKTTWLKTESEVFADKKESRIFYESFWFD